MHLSPRGGGGTRMSKGYQAHPKIHVIRVVFQDQALYACTSFRGAKTCKIGKKGVFFGHIDKFWKEHDRQIKKNACKNAYLGSFFTPEKDVIRVLFESPWMSLIPPLAIQVPPPASHTVQLLYCLHHEVLHIQCYELNAITGTYMHFCTKSWFPIYATHVAMVWKLCSEDSFTQQNSYLSVTYTAQWLHGDWTVSSLLTTASNTVTVTVLPAANNGDYTSLFSHRVVTDGRGVLLCISAYVYLRTKSCFQIIQYCLTKFMQRRQF